MDGTHDSTSLTLFGNTVSMLGDATSLPLFGDALSIFDDALASSDLWEIHLHNHRIIQASISKNLKYDIEVHIPEQGQENIEKIHIKFLYAAELSTKIMPLIKQDERVQEMNLEPIRAPGRRYHIKNKSLFPLMKEKEVLFLLEAYSLLRKAIESNVDDTSTDRFLNCMKKIEGCFPDKELLNSPPERKKYNYKYSSEFEEFLIEYCLKNKLYLNICGFCQKCDSAIGDPVSIQKMITPIKSGKEKDSFKNDPFWAFNN